MNTPVDLVFWTTLGLAAGALLALVAPRFMTSPPRLLPLVVVAAGVTALLFGLTMWRMETWLDLLTHSVFAAIAVQLATIDMIRLELPRSLIWPTFGALTLLLTASAVTYGEFGALVRAALGAATLTTVYLVIALASRGGLGAGDVRLAAPVGLMLAWHSWPTLATGAALGFIGSSILAFTLLTTRGPRSVPHGPAMLISVVATTAVTSPS